MWHKTQKYLNIVFMKKKLNKKSMWWQYPINVKTNFKTGKKKPKLKIKFNFKIHVIHFKLTINHIRLYSYKTKIQMHHFPSPSHYSFQLLKLNLFKPQKLKYSQLSSVFLALSLLEIKQRYLQ